MHTARQNHKTFGDIFSKKVFLIFFNKTHESMGLYNGKTTTTIPLFCSDPDSVAGETSEFGTANNLEGVSQKKAY